MVQVVLPVLAFIISLIALIGNLRKAGRDELRLLRQDLERCEQQCAVQQKENIALLRDLARQAREGTGV